MNGLQLIATGGALPGRTVTNEDLSRVVDTSDEWITTRTGIRTRHWCTEGESAATLAIAAARQALERSGLAPEQIACCVCATLSAPDATPSVACQVQRALGLPEDRPALDVNAACSGFVYGTAVARGLLTTLGGQYALVVGCEALSRLMDLKAQIIAPGRGLGLPHTGSSLPGRTAPLTGRASTALTAAKPAAAIAAMTALPGAIAIRPWPAILPRRAGSTGFLGQQPLDGKRDLSVRGHVDDLDFDRIAIVQDGCNVLHEFIGHLGNMDHAHAALRQRDKRAKRLHACDTTLENVSYLNCQSSILLFFS